MTASAWRWIAGGLVIIALAGLGAIALLPRGEPVAPTVSAEPVATASARALLGDPKVGERLVGWTILAIDGPRDGVIRIDLGHQGVRFALMVARIGTMPQLPPLETQHYAIYYGHIDPPDTTLPPNTIRATTNALAHRIRAHEATITVDGM